MLGRLELSNALEKNQSFHITSLELDIFIFIISYLLQSYNLFEDSNTMYNL